MSRYTVANILLLATLLLAACRPAPADQSPQAGLPNPASVYCEENGGTLEFRQDESGGTYGVCLFPDGSECEEWAFYRAECTPGGPEQTAAEPAATEPEDTPIPELVGPSSRGSSSPAAPPEPLESPAPGALDPVGIPTPVPIDPEGYQGWWTHTEPDYGFSLRLPPDWVVVATTSADALMKGHLLELQPEPAAGSVNIRLTYRRVGEEVLLWPTGVGAGEFVPVGTLEIAGAPANRKYFVCPTGQVQSVWYHGGEGEPNVQRGELEFGIIISFQDVYCQEGYSLEGKLLRVAEMVVASLEVE